MTLKKNILQENLSQYGVDMATLELTQQDSDAGYGLKVVLNEEPARWCQGLIFHMQDMQERLAHAAEYTYVRFWISNPNSAAISIMLQPVKDGTNCTLDAKSAVLVRCDGASVNTETSNASGAGEDTSVVVPAGFIGWVSYPLSVASVSLWNGKTCSLAEASQFKLDIRPSATAVSEYYVLDDFVFSDSTSGKVRAYEYQDPKEEEYMKLREELDTKIKSYLNVVPEVQNYPKYDPIGKKILKPLPMRVQH